MLGLTKPGMVSSLLHGLRGSMNSNLSLADSSDDEGSSDDEDSSDVDDEGSSDDEEQVGWFVLYDRVRGLYHLLYMLDTYTCVSTEGSLF